MPYSGLLCLLPLILAARSATAGLSSPDGRFTRRALTPVRSPASLAVTSNYSPLMRFHASNDISAVSSAYIVAYGHTHLSDHAGTEVFVIQASIGGEKVPLILDTGSSDTWVAQKGFTCTNGAAGVVLPQVDCGFGPTFNGSFPKGPLPNENFLITYGNGYSVSGSFGYLDVIAAGVHVKNQQVALANQASIVLDGLTSGLMGLAYSALTSEFVGTNITVDNQNITGTAPGDQSPYSPLVQTMITQGLNPPIFSLALQRAKHITDLTSPGGYVAFGGLPPVAFDPDFVTTPLEIHEFYEYPPLTARNYSFYTITPHGYVTINKAGNRRHHPIAVPTIIDSGTLPLLLPTEVYDAYIGSLPVPVVENQGSPYVNCDSTLPPLGVNIGGTVFNISGVDILYPLFNYTNATDGVTYCSLALDESPHLPILGATWLKNVVAVFDVGAAVMRIAAHDY